MLGFLFVDEANFTIDPVDGAKALTPDAEPVLAAADEALAGVEPWAWEAIERALRDALLEDGLGLKPRVAFSGALRVAITGRRIGPPLFQSIELLGRDRTLSRLARARAIATGGGALAGEGAPSGGGAGGGGGPG
jgi:glutamyl-tRNA synthetase